MSLGLAFPDGSLFRLVPRSVGLDPLTVPMMLRGASADYVYGWHELGMRSPELLRIASRSAQLFYRMPCEHHC